MLQSNHTPRADAGGTPTHAHESPSSEAVVQDESSPRRISSNLLQDVLSSAEGLLLCGKASPAFTRAVASLTEQQGPFLQQKNLDSSIVAAGKLEIPGFQAVPTSPNEGTYKLAIATIPRKGWDPVVPRYGFIELDVQAPSRVLATTIRGRIADLIASKESGKRIVTITLAPPAALENLSTDLARQDSSSGYLVGLHAVVSRDAADALVTEVLRGKSYFLLHDLFARQAIGSGAALISVIQQTMIDPLCSQPFFENRYAALDRYYYAFAAGFQGQNTYSRALRTK